MPDSRSRMKLTLSESATWETVRSAVPELDMVASTGDEALNGSTAPKLMLAGETDIPGALTVVSCVAVLFDVSGSNSSPETVAVFNMPPPTVGVTSMVIVEVAPALTVPRSQVTIPDASLQPAEAETKVTPVGSVSVNVTFVPSMDELLFVTVTVYVRVLLMSTGSGLSVLSTERSTEGVTSVVA